MDWNALKEILANLFNISGPLKGAKRLVSIIVFTLLVAFIIFAQTSAFESLFRDAHLDPQLAFWLIVLVLGMVFVIILAVLTPDLVKGTRPPSAKDILVTVKVHQPGRRTAYMAGIEVRATLAGRGMLSQTTDSSGTAEFHFPGPAEGKTATFGAYGQGQAGPEKSLRLKLADNSVELEWDFVPLPPAPASRPRSRGEDPPTVEAQALREAYLSWVFAQSGRLSLFGIDRQESDEGAAQVSLNAVYTALLTQTPAEQELERLGRREPSGREPGRRSALEQLDREAHLVLLGEPGSGKSTFVNFVAMCLAGQALARPEAGLELLTAPLPPEKEDEKPAPQPWQWGPLLPVQVIVRDFAARGLPPPGQAASLEHLWDFLRGEWQAIQLGEFVPAVQKIFREEGGLLLVDGLDEVFETEKRRGQVKQVVESFAAAYPRCRVLVTSRTYAYQEQNWKLSGFQETVLAPFSLAQINCFIERWYACCVAQKRVDPQNAGGNAELLKRAIAREERLLELARRPLLLTLMAALHAWRGGKLPDRRQELYEETVDLLLNRWEGRRVLKDPQGRVVDVIPSLSEWLKLGDRKAVRALLERLAYQAHRAQAQPSGTADVPEDDLLVGLMKLKNEAPVDRQKLKEFLTERAGLLLARGEGVYTFPHRTIQEYLAACHLTNSDELYPDEAARLACQDPLRWREVALLAGAKAGAGVSRELWFLVDALCPEDAGAACSPEGQWGALIAGGLVLENVDLVQLKPASRARVERLKTRLAPTLQGRDLPALERARAGVILAGLGDPRPEVMTVAGMRFCCVPGGPFAFQEGQTVDLPTFWLGLHPVSQAQFVGFMQDGGYVEPRWWPEAIAAEHWSKDGFKREMDPESRQSPALWGAPFDLPNHPVIGITWYEALAFTRWLDERVHREGWLPDGWQVRLPTEQEWEKAARGGLDLPAEPAIRALAEGPDWPEPHLQRPNPLPRREYPWGDGFDDQKANTREAKIGGTSALGCFAAGAGPYGNLDLSGNVWEWQENGDGDDKAEDWTSRKSMRGGSWLDDDHIASCASRRSNLPIIYQSPLLGLRCALSPRS